MRLLRSVDSRLVAFCHLAVQGQRLCSRERYRRAQLAPTALVAGNVLAPGSALLVASLPKAFQTPVAAIVAGAFVGVVAWYSILIVAASRVSTRLQASSASTLHRVLGALVLALALVHAVAAGADLVHRS